ncbi:sensor histidine kinase [Thiolinea disciformis]|uniref:sensor histidine kinase n=1 Tax=Thiolinea disciformis TaxID=125614 RepID=UPI000366B32B|nr:ATP-binding protein [Thiolinea disciformis]
MSAGQEDYKKCGPPLKIKKRRLRKRLEQHWQAKDSKFYESRFHNSRLRKHLFLQIYFVVLASIITLALVFGTLAFLHDHHPAPHQRADRPPIFFMIFISVAVVGLAAYPISRRLTHRLDRLKQGVEALGAGHLSTRVEVQGQDEIALLARSFNQSAERIQILVNNHRQLLANASHELRSPLARLRMGLELIAEQESAQTANLAPLRQDIRELDQLVEEILLASRLDTPEIPLENKPVDLDGLVAEECARLQLECETQAVTLLGDARLLRRLLRNLLENATRHGGGEIEASLTLLQPTLAQIKIADRGKGIPDEERSRIFEPFYRPAGHGEGQGGWGLGLSLVKQIAERHGGQVRCLAREGGGTRFEVDLPITRSPV